MNACVIFINQNMENALLKVSSIFSLLKGFLGEFLLF